MRFEPRWLIVEWLGFWAISDHHHGGVNSGPHKTKELAEETLASFAARQFEGWAEMVDPEMAERERRYVMARNQIIQVDWPMTEPEEAQ